MSQLLLGAFPPELGPFIETPPAGWKVACTGVGQLLAAASTARLLEEFHPTGVLFVGTCGHFDDRLKVGDIIWAAEAISSSLGECRGESGRPIGERTRWPATLPPMAFPAYRVVVPPALTRTREGTALLGALGEAEHLELTGVFAACHSADVPVGAVLVVVHEAGPHAQSQWLANHAAQSERLIKVIQKLGLLGKASMSPK